MAMKVFLLMLLGFTLFAEEPKTISINFFDNCVENYQENNHVKTVQEWFKQVKNINKCESEALTQLIRDALYVDNAILALDFQSNSIECKEKFKKLSSSLEEYLSYIKILKLSNQSCKDSIANYWTHILGKYTDVYKKPSEHSTEIMSLRKGTKLKFISNDRTTSWAEFKFENNGQSLTGWIKVVDTEELNE